MTLGLGTPLYMAPELYGLSTPDGNVSYDTKVDVFAYGMLLYELVTAKEPFSSPRKSLTATEVGNMVVQGRRPTFTPEISESWTDFIEGCWHQNPAQRPSFEGMVSEPDEFKLEGCEDEPFEIYKTKVLAFLDDLKSPPK
jgi:serine/threonine protein kinase